MPSSSVRASTVVAALAILLGSCRTPITLMGSEALPRYSHVFVIVEENKSFEQILSPAFAPTIARLAGEYGSASRFYGEVHPSEGNYVAMLGGDTFGIHDDDAFYCKPRSVDPFCPGAAEPNYRDHTAYAPHLGQQLERSGLTWKGYYENLPEPGSLAIVAGALVADGVEHPAALYAFKHSGFLTFAGVQKDPRRAEKIVGFDQFDADLRADRLPNFALIVPNQCNEMHGLRGPGVPADCDIANPSALIARGDRGIADLVARLQASSAWRSQENMAIVITFDEGSGGTREGCCGVTPKAPSNFGGGHIPTLVITNHGPRGVIDDTPYNHYSLLRTVEDVFGISEHLGHAADTALGVTPMRKLFATSGAPGKPSP